MENKLLFIIALLSAIWFALTSIFWVYWIALYIAYPFGIISFFLWKSNNNVWGKKQITIPILLFFGLLVSLLFLFIPLIAGKF